MSVGKQEKNIFRSFGYSSKRGVSYRIKKIKEMKEAFSNPQAKLPGKMDEHREMAMNESKLELS